MFGAIIGVVAVAFLLAELILLTRDEGPGPRAPGVATDQPPEILVVTAPKQPAGRHVAHRYARSPRERAPLH